MPPNVPRRPKTSISHGMMAGQYEMVAADGRRFDVEIPTFSLDMPTRARAIN